MTEKQTLTMSCAGCGDVREFELGDPAFSEWWIEHGKCLRAEPAPEIDRRVKHILEGRGS